MSAPEEKTGNAIAGTEQKSEVMPERLIDSPPLVNFYWQGEHPVTRVSWLVDRIFREGTVNLIVGESQAGKTYIALDLAVAIASGRPFFGKQTRQGGVLYIAAEGAITIPGRLHAARQGLSIDRRLIAVMHEPPPNLMVESDVNRVIATALHINEKMLEATGLPLVAIIIDTMMYGFAINNWNDVGETSKAMKVLSRVQSEVGAAVVGVHHHGKDPNRGAAGSYAFTAAADTILSVYKKGDEGAVKARWVTLTKSRFTGTGQKLNFDLETLPPDRREEEGDEEMFVVPLLGDPVGVERSSEKSKSSASHGEAIFSRAFRTALKSHGIDGNRDHHGVIRAASLSTVKAVFMESYIPKGAHDPMGAKRKAWDRALEKIEGGPVSRDKWDGQEWLFIKTDGVCSDVE